jgi:hypothetical protein
MTQLGNVVAGAAHDDNEQRRRPTSAEDVGERAALRWQLSIMALGNRNNVYLMNHKSPVVRSIIQLLNQ